ncbi:ABC transporter permease [Afifella sp. JA880]|uniref:ABC transporter permease n=1 Tax=Afifella sp. JA880 TaxID=2975280 RepID=UPI0021BAEB40|nr:ABC transporter permease [Afifella sp. JA880]MCT8265690.1 ABC transporter permease [Afifella sp. JA880]
MADTTPSHPAPTSKRPGLQARLNEEFLAEVVLYGIAAIVLALIALRLGGAFFNATNLVSVLEQVPEFALFSLAMAIAMITGGIDLSVIAVADLSAIFAAYIMTNPSIVDALGPGGAIALATVVALGASVLMGLFNGIIIARFGVPALVTTLGTMLLYFGLASGLTGGVGITGMPSAFTDILMLKLGPIPVSFCGLAVLFVLASFYIRNSLFGKTLYLYGDNKVAALFTGLPINRAIIISYALSGLLAGAAGLIMLARFNSMKVGFGDTFLLQAILVAVLAGMDPYGGRGRLLNVLAAVLLLQCVENAFTIEGLSPYAKKMIWGGLLLIFMALNFFVRRIVRRSLTRAALRAG